MAQKIFLEVIKKEQVTPSTFFVTFRLTEPPTISFTSGQNMMLMIAPGVNRTMSIASPPQDDKTLLMVHDVSPMGPGSQWTLKLAVGDKATIVAPTGGALSFVDSVKRKVLVATGTGIAPFHAMVLDAMAQHKTMPIVLYWGLRYETDLYWKDEFDRIATQYPNFTWHLIFSRAGEGWQGWKGHVTEHVLREEKDMANSEFYLCGNKAMIEEVRMKLLAQNVPKEQVKSELFY